MKKRGRPTGIGAEQRLSDKARAALRHEVAEAAGGEVFALGRPGPSGLVESIEVLARGVREAEMGLLMGGGWETFGANAARPRWGDTAIGALLPTEDVIDAYNEWGFLVFDDKEHEFVTSLPWHTKPEFIMIYWHNQVKVKPGF